MAPSGWFWSSCWELQEFLVGQATLKGWMWLKGFVWERGGDSSPRTLIMSI